jgi:hypothetical protein
MKYEKTTETTKITKEREPKIRDIEIEPKIRDIKIEKIRKTERSE